MRIFLFWFCSFSIFSVVAQTPATLSNSFSKCPQPPAPNYQETKYWAALPGVADQADIVPKGQADLQQIASADVFFIHPTTYTGKPQDSFEWNADVNNEELNNQVNERPIKYQSSIFNQSCRVYAPRYRQAHYYAFLTPNGADRKQALELAYSDVKRAFEYYLNHYNKKRPIVIAAHSQGTIHAQRLLREFFENKPLDSLLLVAYLVGMPVPKDSLPALVPCDSASQTHCYLSWRTFEKGHEPHWGKGDFVCHNPISWRMDSAYMPKEKQAGAVLRSFKRPYISICDAQVHGNILWVTKPKFFGSSMIKNPNYHVGDYNLFYLDIRKNVDLRVQTFMALHPVN
ncbi:MAG: DUF3089 domain-containing protein [Bacteroidia bacterium]|nr:DUF3089 domain-containing protein [Bacteroidia bacterium]